jgi:hypothetical protein
VRGAPLSFGLKRGTFLLRLGVAYLVVPLTAPVLLMVYVWLAGQRLVFWDRLGIVLLFAVFGFGAMVVFGLPLLLVYARLHWTGYPAFLAGGALCAALTYSLVMRGQPEPASLVLFTAFGIVEGLFLRVILFGAAARPHPAAP